MISEQNKLESDYMAASSQLRVSEVQSLLLSFYDEVPASDQFENLYCHLEYAFCYMLSWGTILWNTVLCILCYVIAGGVAVIRVPHIVMWQAESPTCSPNPYESERRCQQVAAGSVYCTLYVP